MKKRTKEEASEYLQHLDVEKVGEAIRDEGRTELLDFDLETVAEQVWNAAETWLPGDVETYQIVAVEEKQSTATYTGPLMLEAVVDLKLVDPRDGTLTVVDWKTTSGELGVKWRNRMRGSWQGRLYLFTTEARQVQFRGVARNGDVGLETIEQYDTLRDDVKVQLQGMVAVHKAVELLPVWPRYMPSACFAFGRTCPYLEDCWNGKMPRQTPPQRDYVSYSYLDRLAHCPELARRQALDEVESSYEQRLGQAFHRGIAEVYRQAARVFQGREINQEETVNA